MSTAPDNTRQAFWFLHIAVLAYGFTAILGALLHIDAISLVWWRLLLTLGALLVMFNPGKGLFALSGSLLYRLILSGLTITAHWICFYGSIKLANASIAVVMLATMPLFTAIMYPLFTRGRVDWLQIGIGLLVIPGMAMIFNVTDLSMRAGIWMGLVAAFLSSFFTVQSKSLLDVTPLRSLVFIQLTSGFVFLTIGRPLFVKLGFVTQFMPIGIDWLWLFILSVVCTVMAFIFTARALRVLNPFTVNLTINLEPLYGVVLAILILKENKELDVLFYIGMLVILTAVFLYPIISNRRMKI